MVAWQVEVGDIGEAVQAIERGHARSLLDEMNRGGTDLNLGRSAAERAAIREKTAQLTSRVAQLEKQLEQASQPGQPGNSDQLRAALGQARNDLYEHYRDERNSSPVYRNLLSTGSVPPGSANCNGAYCERMTWPWSICLVRRGAMWSSWDRNRHALFLWRWIKQPPKSWEPLRARSHLHVCRKHSSAQKTTGLCRNWPSGRTIPKRKRIYV